ncbi:acyltransferase family protein [Streptomyces sp. C10-9-1]|uniref:acyltransferase family protein n=1 Tax=Streptomyces sp. C10-9-1 TaxID=1859285 RepID=UPI003D757391
MTTHEQAPGPGPAPAAPAGAWQADPPPAASPTAPVGAPVGVREAEPPGAERPGAERAGAAPAGPPEAGPPRSATTGPEGAGAPPAQRRQGRDRYLDLLRSIALVRVVVYHVFGWAWLTILFPSMGVMFALAGMLMARSLDRPARQVIMSRVRRLLPPLWAFGAVTLTVLLVGGWNPLKGTGDGAAWGLVRVLSYLVPFGAPPYPPGDDWAMQAAGPLWYLRAYLWFVLASPLLLWAFRRVPWAVLAAPLALTAVVGTGLVAIPGETGEAVTDFAVYGGCWVLGFAHHDGLLKRIPRYAAVSWGFLVMAFGLWWASGHAGAGGWNLNEIPLAQAAWSFGFVLILLQYAPSWERLPGRLAKWDGLVTLSNNRAVTIYLWHNLLIFVAGLVVSQGYRLPFLAGERGDAALDATYSMWTFVVVWPLIALAVLAFGWIEDVAARRRPRLWPNGTAGNRTGRRARRT